MPFSEIFVNIDGCCLVRYNDTVYKVKVIFGQEVRTCDIEEFRLELEQVFRAVLHLAENDKPIPPLYTNHLMVKPLKKDWAIYDKIGFRQNSKDLQPSRYYLQFHISERPVWKATEDRVLTGKKSFVSRHQESTSKQTPRKDTADTGAARENQTGDIHNDAEHTALPETGSEDRETNKRNSKNSELEKQQTSSGQTHDTEVHSKELENELPHGRELDNEKLPHKELREKTNIYVRKEKDKEKDKTVSDDPREEDQPENRRLRRSIRISEISKEKDYTEKQSARKHVDKAAVSKLSQSGVTEHELDITVGMETHPTDREHSPRKKRQSRSINTHNVDDITGFSYKVNKFRSKIFNKGQSDNQMDNKKRHVLYRPGGLSRGRDRPPLIMELPEVGLSNGTAEIPNKTKVKRRSNTVKISTQERKSLPVKYQTRSFSEQKHVLTRAPIQDKPSNEHGNKTVFSAEKQKTTGTRVTRDRSTDSSESTASSTDSQSLRDEVQKQNTPQSNKYKSKILTRSSLKGQMLSGTSKGQRAYTRSSELPKNLATPAKTGKVFTRSMTSSNKSRMRSLTPSRSNRGQMRSATSSTHRRQMRSATLSEGPGKCLRSGSSSRARNGHLRSALLSRSPKQQMRSSPSVESERLMKMRHPVESGVQVNDVDRYLVQQEELKEMSKLQKMASMHDKPSSYSTHSRKRSGLWDFMDSMIITPAKKMFKRV